MEKNSRYGYLKEYRREKLKRVTIDLPSEKYTEWKEACEALGKPLTAVVKLAVDFYLADNVQRNTEPFDRLLDVEPSAADVPSPSNTL